MRLSNVEIFSAVAVSQLNITGDFDVSVEEPSESSGIMPGYASCFWIFAFAKYTIEIIAKSCNSSVIYTASRYSLKSFAFAKYTYTAGGVFAAHRWDTIVIRMFKDSYLSPLLLLRPV